jgi:hypothetical protein
LKDVVPILNARLVDAANRGVVSEQEKSLDLAVENRISKLRAGQSDFVDALLSLLADCDGWTHEIDEIIHTWA